MRRVTILEGTTKNPLQKIGCMAGVCVGADVSDAEKNITRAKECMTDGHWFMLGMLTGVIVALGVTVILV